MPDLQRIVKMYPLIFNIFLCLRCSSGLANKICLLCITIPAGRSRSVKNVADTKLFASLKLAKSKYRRFSRPASTAMHKRRPQEQESLNCNHHYSGWQLDAPCAAGLRKRRVVCYNFTNLSIQKGNMT